MTDWIHVKNINNDYFLSYQYKKSNMLPLEAAYFTIHQIQNKYPPPYTLMLSGGVDSQAMLYAWHTSQVPYTTFSGIYNNGMNENDLSTMREFSKLFNIHINYYDIDILNFLQNEHVEYVYKFRCGSPHMTIFMKMIEMIKEGTVILSGNFIKTNNPQFLPISKNNFSLYKFAKQENKSVVPFFFCESQELAFSIVDTVTHNSNKLDYSVDMYEYKNKVRLYQQYGFPVIEQPKKLTGFELVKDYYDANFSHLVTTKDKLKRLSKVQSSNRTFDLLFRNKYEAEFHCDKYSIKFIPE